ncbi:MAG TPA: glycosyltransferase [Patescibacteria group bacterium]|nr:glycosyltransferase [Patescibacteria group bacterium]
MKKKQPLADIFILNTNAKPTLRKLLRELGRLSYSKKLIRIIVCDNNSTDGSKEMLTREFPDVHVVALKKNHGMSGLNYGFKMRKGELCFVLDDDSYFQRDVIEKALEEFDRDPHLGILSCNAMNAHDQVYEAKYLPIHGTQSVTWCDFVGGGVVIRSRVFDDIGYFNPDILIYGHEADFALRALDKGWKIRFAPHIRVFRISRPNAMNAFRMSLGVRNFSSVYFRYLSLPLAFEMMALMLGEYFFIALRSRTLPAYFQGILKLLGNIPYIVKSRRRVKPATEHFWSELYPFSPRNTIRRLMGTYSIQEKIAFGQKLNLGCGNRAKEGYINVDNNPLLKDDGVIMHDLNNIPYPFADDIFEEIRMDHVLEHLDDPLTVLQEVYRIAKNGCKVFVRCPHFSYGWVHPQHKSPISSWLFSYLDTRNFEHYGNTHFEVDVIRLYWLVPATGRPIIVEMINRVITFLANIHVGVTQRLWCYWVGGFEEILFAVTVKKP